LAIYLDKHLIIYANCAEFKRKNKRDLSRLQAAIKPKVIDDYFYYAFLNLSQQRYQESLTLS
jgi:hypothetical protein